MLKLVFPMTEDKEQVIDMVRELKTHSPEIDGIDLFEGVRVFEHISNYEDWLVHIEELQNREKVSDNYVPATTYLVKEEGYLVGAISIRHSLNENLLKIGGHIGYGIRPSERRKGYGSEMLKLALEECRRLNLEKVLITCKRQNRPSAKVIEKNGGTFENEVLSDDGKHIYLRYWITL